MPRRGGRVREEGGSRGSWTVRQKETDAPLFLELRGFRVFSKQRRLSKYPQTPIKRTSFIRYGTNDTTLRYDFRSFVPLTAKSLVFVCRVVRDTTRFQRVARLTVAGSQPRRCTLTLVKRSASYDTSVNATARKA